MCRQKRWDVCINDMKSTVSAELISPPGIPRYLANGSCLFPPKVAYGAFPKKTRQRQRHLEALSAIPPTPPRPFLQIVAALVERLPQVKTTQQRPRADESARASSTRLGTINSHNCTHLVNRATRTSDTSKTFSMASPRFLATSRRLHHPWCHSASSHKVPSRFKMLCLRNPALARRKAPWHPLARLGTEPLPRLAGTFERDKRHESLSHLIWQVGLGIARCGKVRQDMVWQVRLGRAGHGGARQGAVRFGRLG